MVDRTKIGSSLEAEEELWYEATIYPTTSIARHVASYCTCLAIRHFSIHRRPKVWISSKPAQAWS